MTLPDGPTPEDAPGAGAGDTGAPDEFTYRLRDATATSVSGPLDEREIDTAQGLVDALRFAPKVEELVASGQLEAAITIFQEATGATRAEAEGAIQRLHSEFLRIQRAWRVCIRWLIFLLFASAAVIFWWLFR
jgi:hypothetical protein